jgi:tetratricopeptide (TPR) repeat protein
MRFAALLVVLGLVLAAVAPGRADNRTDYEAALAAIKQGKRDQAIALLTKIIDSKEECCSTLANLHYLRAELYSVAGKLDEAIADYGRTIEAMPDHAGAYHDRALVYAQQKKFAEALDDLSRAQFLIPNSPLVYFNRGRVYEMMGKKDLAIDEYRKARALAPKMKEPQEALKRLGAP